MLVDLDRCCVNQVAFICFSLHSSLLSALARHIVMLTVFEFHCFLSYLDSWKTAFFILLTKIQGHLSWENNTFFLYALILVLWVHWELDQDVFFSSAGKIFVISLFNRHVKSRHRCIWIKCSHCNVYRTSSHG